VPYGFVAVVYVGTGTLVRLPVNVTLSQCEAVSLCYVLSHFVSMVLSKIVFFS